MSRLRVFVIASLAGCAAAGSAWGTTPSLVALGVPPPAQYSYGYGLNGSGQVAAGTLFESGIDRAFVWTADVGMRRLDNPSGLPHGQTWGVSGDGGRVVGESRSSQSGSARAVVWSVATGQPTPLAPLPMAIESYGRAANADGSIVAGWSWSGVFGTAATRWVNGAPQRVGENIGATHAFDVSADGSVVVGSGSLGVGFRWTQAGGGALLPLPAGMTGSLAVGVSEDGSITVGTANNINVFPPVTTAVRWTPSGVELLGGLAGASYSEARGVSGDGRSVVGVSAGDPFDPIRRQRAFLWTESGGMQDLTTLAGPWASI